MKGAVKLSFQLTLPGALSLYYGQELGLTNVGNPPSPRGVMQWTPSGSDHHGFLSSSEANIGKLFFDESSNADEQDNFEVGTTAWHIAV